MTDEQDKRTPQIADFEMATDAATAIALATLKVSGFDISGGACIVVPTPPTVIHKADCRLGAGIIDCGRLRELLPCGRYDELMKRILDFNWNSKTIAEIIAEVGDKAAVT